MVQVTISLIDGGLHEFEEGDEFVSLLYDLKSQGIEGKALVHQLISDDWGAPPVYVKITGNTSEGKEVNEHIPYS